MVYELCLVSKTHASYFSYRLLTGVRNRSFSDMFRTAVLAVDNGGTLHIGRILADNLLLAD
jgi:hypothetical protein